MGFLSRLFKGKPSTEERIRWLADSLVEVSTIGPNSFEDLLPRGGPTRDRALAECHALVASITAYALWATLGSKEKIFAILDVFQPAFVASLSPGCKEILLSIAIQREDEYVKGIFETLKSGDTRRAIELSSLMARRISGHTDPNDIDDPDIIRAMGLWHVVVNNTISLKQCIEKLQKIPSFSDLMT